MSRRGNCWDGAVVESFFNLPNRERIRRRKHKAREKGRQGVFDYIEFFYNPKRKHVWNGTLPPIAFEQQQKPNHHQFKLLASTGTIETVLYSNERLRRTFDFFCPSGRRRVQTTW